MRSRILAFVQALRAEGIDVSLAETMDAVRAVAAAGVQREVLRESLAACLVKYEEDRPVFDRLFDASFPLVGAEREAGRRRKRVAGGGGALATASGRGAASGRGRPAEEAAAAGAVAGADAEREPRDRSGRARTRAAGHLGPGPSPGPPGATARAHAAPVSRLHRPRRAGGTRSRPRARPPPARAARPPPAAGPARPPRLPAHDPRLDVEWRRARAPALPRAPPGAPGPGGAL